MMDTQLLRAFVELTRNGSFSLTATLMHLSQPTVSKRIATLESRLRVTLLDRVGRSVVLTEAGRLFLPHAEHILQELEDGQRALAGLSDRIAGPLSVGTSHHVGLHRLPPALRRFVADHPDVNLDLQFLESETACRRVAQGTLELAIVTLPPDDTPPLAQIPLWRDEMHVVVGEDHPLASLPTLTLRALSAYPAVLPEADTFTTRLVNDGLRANGITARISVNTNYLETIRMLVTVGLGWSVLPRSMFQPGIKPLLVDSLTINRRLGIVRHAKRGLSRAAGAMIDVLRATCDS